MGEKSLGRAWGLKFREELAGEKSRKDVQVGDSRIP